MKLYGLREYRFVDPRTIIGGKDHRGWEVVELYTKATLMPPGSPPTTPTWAAFIEEFAERQENFATWCEQEMRAYGRLDKRHPGHVHAPTADDPCPQCAVITADARSATRTELRNVLAKIEVPRE